MFILQANKNQLTVRQREPVTSGSVRVCQAAFRFSADWKDLTRTAVFRAGEETRSVLLDENGAAEIPWEVLKTPDLRLYCGVCGTRGDDLVLPTIWAQLGYIQAGAVPGPESRPPTPDPGGGEGGTTDHRQLTHREAAGQHPITAIAGLKAELDRIPEPVEAITNSELEEMLK